VECSNGESPDRAILPCTASSSNVVAISPYTALNSADHDFLVSERQSESIRRRNARARILVSYHSPKLHYVPAHSSPPSASCATIVRLKYLTLYSDPLEFLYGTGKIGFWSLIEEGIGIIAGSLPALRPLLSLRIRVTTSSTNPASGNAYASHSQQHQPRSTIKMDTFHTLREIDGSSDDGSSQRKIIKETKYTVTSSHGIPQGKDPEWNDKHSTYL
jgi:hypothetical protein